MLLNFRKTTWQMRSRIKIKTQGTQHIYQMYGQQTDLGWYYERQGEKNPLIHT